MSLLWIVHRRDRERTALLRLAAENAALAGDPGDTRFDAAEPARVVVLGLSGDWEAELEFAHRQRTRLPDARWILVGDAERGDAARHLFDQLPVEYMSYPPSGEKLRHKVAEANVAGRPSLSERSQREAVSARFSRWLADLELPELMRALDPRLAGVPLLVSGEVGSGRATLVRYVQLFGSSAGTRLLQIPCDAGSGFAQIEAALAGAARAAWTPQLCVWLDEVDRLPPALQRQLADAIENGLPGVRAGRLRWIATRDERGAALEETLGRVLDVLHVRLPPLRERGDAFEALVAESAAAWAIGRRDGRREFSSDAIAALKEYPWPGNLRELDALLARTLARHGGDPIRAADLCWPGDPAGASPLPDPDFDPLDAPGHSRTPQEDEVWRTPESDELGVFSLFDEVVDADQLGELLSEDEGPDEGGGARDASRAEDPVENAPAQPGGSPAAGAQAGGSAVGGATPSAASLRHLARELSRSSQDPDAALRRFADALPEHFDDPAIRARFVDTLRDDMDRIQKLLGRIEQLGDRSDSRAEPVDVSALLERLLGERQEAIRRQHVLVLKELETPGGVSLAERAPLETALETLLDKALERTAERGELYVLARKQGAARGGPQVVLRFHEPASDAAEAPLPFEESPEVLLADLLLQALGGHLHVGEAKSEERVLVIDLPAA